MILYKLIWKKPDMPWNAMISISSSRISCFMSLVGAFCCHFAPLLFSKRWLLIGVLWPSLDRWRRLELTVGGVQDGPLIIPVISRGPITPRIMACITPVTHYLFIRSFIGVKTLFLACLVGTHLVEHDVPQVTFLETDGQPLAVFWRWSNPFSTGE